MPPDSLIRHVREQLTTWRQFLVEPAWERVYKAVKNEEQDESHGQHRPHHRLRSAIGHDSSEIRVGPEEYHPVVRAVLRAGLIIQIYQTGTPYICTRTRIPTQAFGFDAEKLTEFAIQERWPDQEITFALTWVFEDYSDRHTSNMLVLTSSGESIQRW